ncbi:MAG TPA: hypothetical protein EYO33_25540 [Phycisphaerales bacterium]|nr:hypothetical protein [Phycisphaerales bacterium]
MTTISLTSPRTAKEIRNLAWAQGEIRKAEAEVATVIARDNAADDFIPSLGSVAVADLTSAPRTTLTGSVNYDVESKEITSANLEKTRPVEVEVDHMMWGTYRGVTSLEIEKSPEKASYKFHDQVGNKITRDYNIVLDHQNQTLSYDFDIQKGPWVGRSRGL